MAGPNHEVSGLGVLHPAEVFSPVVKIGRTRVGIGKACPEIYGVYQVGTIRLNSGTGVDIKRGGNDRSPVVLA